MGCMRLPFHYQTSSSPLLTATTTRTANKEKGRGEKERKRIKTSNPIHNNKPFSEQVDCKYYLNQQQSKGLFRLQLIVPAKASSYNKNKNNTSY
eukprot:m.35657 g.35657  ORF g.35657 m.35657 type:complete len:94 (-) comp11172_c1_seq1:339-620(-)